MTSIGLRPAGALLLVHRRQHRSLDLRTEALNKRPLPKNTVAKNRSSSRPRRSRRTPMNHRKAIPANGTRFNPSATGVRIRTEPQPGSWGSAGTEIHSSQNAATVNKENSIPAMAAAFGVFRFVRLKASFGVTACASQRSSEEPRTPTKGRHFSAWLKAPEP
jgi:hypothetical protein